MRPIWFVILPACMQLLNGCTEPSGPGHVDLEVMGVTQILGHCFVGAEMQDVVCQVLSVEVVNREDVGVWVESYAWSAFDANGTLHPDACADADRVEPHASRIVRVGFPVPAGVVLTELNGPGTSSAPIPAPE